MVRQPGPTGVDGRHGAQQARPGDAGLPAAEEEGGAPTQEEQTAIQSREPTREQAQL